MYKNYEALDEGEKKDVVQRIYEGSEHIYSLLENLLTWSRSQRGLIEPHPTLLNLREMVDTNVNLHKVAAQKKKITISCQVDRSIQVFGDQNMIATVIRNLINNAVKFTPSTGKIMLTARQKEAYICLLVTDTGIGISKEDQKKLFRIDINTKSIGSSKEKGTGLGLVLCKEFMEKKQGANHCKKH